MKKFINILGLIIIVLIGISIKFFNPTGILTPEDPTGKIIYYTQIINDEVKIGDNNRLEYNLECFDSNGDKKSLTFTTGKKLQEDAFVELYVAPVRGVTYWQELKWDELPLEVQKLYMK